MRSIDTAERRERLGRRHALAMRAGGVDEAVSSIVGLHSSDPVSVYLSAWARVEGFAPSDLEAALYERRSLIRVLGMRRTMFVVPRGQVGVLDAACTRSYGAAERRRLARLLEEQGIAPDGEAWIEEVGHETLAALEARTEATAAQLTADVPELGHKLSFGRGTTRETTVGVVTRILFFLAVEGRVVRARPLGTWLSSQYRWTRIEDWLGEPVVHPPEPDARAALLRAWLRAFGPGTEQDIRWWAGWTVRGTQAALADVGAVPVDLDEGTGFVLEEDLARPEPPPPWVALLPSLDPTVMGWKGRAWYLGANADALFDRNGNAGATVWSDGRVVGGWAQVPDGTVRVRLLEGVSRRAQRAIDAEAERLAAWLGDVRITPRFHTPLERELTAEHPQGHLPRADAR
jgi:hypothetical protein